ncbi:AAA family ATPase [Pelomyxa schiedti]|nr:AAA family ATPase [Pelomyxa schiedti]
MQEGRCCETTTMTESERVLRVSALTSSSKSSVQFRVSPSMLMSYFTLSNCDRFLVLSATSRSGDPSGVQSARWYFSFEEGVPPNPSQETLSQTGHHKFTISSVGAFCYKWWKQKNPCLDPEKCSDICCCGVSFPSVQASALEVLYQFDRAGVAVSEFDTPEGKAVCTVDVGKMFITFSFSDTHLYFHLHRATWFFQTSSGAKVLPLDPLNASILETGAAKSLPSYILLCNKHFRIQLTMDPYAHSLSAPNALSSSCTSEVVIHRGYPGTLSPMSRYYINSGFEWESKLISMICQRGDIVHQPAPPNNKFTPSETINLLRTVEPVEGKRVFIYQACLLVNSTFRASFLNFPQSSVLSFSRCYPDLIEIRRSSNGREAFIIDAKASPHTKAAYNLQLSLYTMILEATCQEKDIPLLVNTTSGGIWLSGENTFSLVHLTSARMYIIQTLLPHVARLAQVATSSFDQVESCLLSACKSCVYSEYCVRRAQEEKSVFLINGIDAEVRDILEENCLLLTVPECQNSLAELMSSPNFGKRCISDCMPIESVSSRLKSFNERRVVVLGPAHLGSSTLPACENLAVVIGLTFDYHRLSLLSWGMGIFNRQRGPKELSPTLIFQQILSPLFHLDTPASSHLKWFHEVSATSVILTNVLADTNVVPPEVNSELQCNLITAVYCVLDKVSAYNEPLPWQQRVHTQIYIWDQIELNAFKAILLSNAWKIPPSFESTEPIASAASSTAFITPMKKAPDKKRTSSKTSRYMKSPSSILSPSSPVAPPTPSIVPPSPAVLPPPSPLFSSPSGLPLPQQSPSNRRRSKAEQDDGIPKLIEDFGAVNLEATNNSHEKDDIDPAKIRSAGAVTRSQSKLAAQLKQRDVQSSEESPNTQPIGESTPTSTRKTTARKKKDSTKTMKAAPEPSTESMHIAHQLPSYVDSSPILALPSSQEAVVTTAPPSGNENATPNVTSVVATLDSDVVSPDVEQDFNDFSKQASRLLATLFPDGLLLHAPLQPDLSSCTPLRVVVLKSEVDRHLALPLFYDATLGDYCAALTQGAALREEIYKLMSDISPLESLDTEMVAEFYLSQTSTKFSEEVREQWMKKKIMSTFEVLNGLRHTLEGSEVHSRLLPRPPLFKWPLIHKAGSGYIPRFLYLLQQECYDFAEKQRFVRSHSLEYQEEKKSCVVVTCSAALPEDQPRPEIPISKAIFTTVMTSADGPHFTQYMSRIEREVFNLLVECTCSKSTHSYCHCCGDCSCGNKEANGARSAAQKKLFTTNEFGALFSKNRAFSNILVRVESTRLSEGGNLVLALSIMASTTVKPGAHYLLCTANQDVTSPMLYTHLQLYGKPSLFLNVIHNPIDWALSSFKPDTLLQFPPEPLPASLLTVEQSKVVKKCFDQHLHLVWGPPGSGKSRVIAATALLMMRQAIRSGKDRFLALAVCFTNTSISTLLQSLSQLNRQQDNEPFCIGRLEKDGKHLRCLNYPTCKHGEMCTVFNFLSNAKFAVIGGTVWQIRHFKEMTKPPMADVILWDEATQSTLPELSIPMCYLKPSGRLLLFGDENQLGPVKRVSFVLSPTLSRLIPEERKGSPWGRLDSSLFGYFQASDQSCSFSSMLTESWRMCTQLCDIMASMLYRNPTNPFHPATQEIASQRLRILDPALLQKQGTIIQNALNPDFAFVFIVVKQETVGVKLIADLCSFLRNNTTVPDSTFWRNTLFVVTPKHIQRLAVLQKLCPCFGQNLTAPLFQSGIDIQNSVNTVEKVQGQERDVVIVDYVFPSVCTGELNFIYNKQRLNVAVTRAKQKCIVVASENLLRHTSGGSVLTNGDQHAISGYTLLNHLIATAQKSHTYFQT